MALSSSARKQPLGISFFIDGVNPFNNKYQTKQTNVYPVCLQFSKIVSCLSTGLGVWGDGWHDFLVERYRDLENGLAIFWVATRCQNRCLWIEGSVRMIVARLLQRALMMFIWICSLYPLEYPQQLTWDDKFADLEFAREWHHIVYIYSSSFNQIYFFGRPGNFGIVLSNVFSTVPYSVVPRFSIPWSNLCLLMMLSGQKITHFQDNSWYKGRIKRQVFIKLARSRRRIFWSRRHVGAAIHWKIVITFENGGKRPDLMLSFSTRICAVNHQTLKSNW